MHARIPRPLALIALPVLAAPVLADGALLVKSGPIQVTPDGAHVWVANRDHDSVARIRTSDLAVAEFPLPDVGEHHGPMGVAITPDGGEVWIAAPDSDRVLVLDAQSGALLAAVPLDAGSGPVSVVVEPGGARAFVALHHANGVAVLDTATHALVRTVDGLYSHPFGMSFTSTPGELWITHAITDGEDAHVSSIDTATLAVSVELILKSVNPKEIAQIAGEADPVPEGGYLFLRGHPAQRPGSGRLWLPVRYQNFHNDVFTPDSTVQAAIHQIDLAAGTPLSDPDRVVLSAVWAHSGTSLLGPGWDAGVSGPVDLAFSADGATAYLASSYSNDVLVVPTSIGMVRSGPALTEIPVGDNPVGLVASPATDRLFVANRLSRDVSVIDTVTAAEIARVPVTPLTSEPLHPVQLTGARLFRSSADPRLSSNGKVACASCHPDGGTDGLLWQFAPLGAGQRKASSLRSLSHSFGPPNGGLGQLHRSGDRDEVQDFDHTARGVTMGGTGFLPAPNPPLGAPNAGLDPDLDALAAYLISLGPLHRSPHRAPDGSLTAAAERGADLFKQSSGPLATGCATCHPAPSYTDLDFHDVGGFAPAPENEGPLFNTPSLVGAWDTGVMVQVTGWVDGQTLGGVVRNARSGAHGDTSGLNRTQLRDLEAFLESIDGALTQTDLGAVGDATAPRVLAVRPVSLSAVEVIFDETVDPATASDPGNYRLVSPGRVLSPTAAVVNAEWGNRVRLAVELAYPGTPIAYTLVPGPVEDVAGTFGGANNALDTSDPANRRSFLLDGTITVTFGDSGLETFPSVARDAGFAAGLGNVSFQRWLLVPTSSPEMKGFVHFDFSSTLVAECGVTSASRIVDARFTAHPFDGHRNTLELHRSLMPWGDPPNDWCFGCPGAVTRNHAMHPTLPWHSAGASAYGGSGTSPAEYYPTGSFDLAASVDAVATMTGVNERLEFAGPQITDAFRFWFDNPTLNYGYAVEVVGSSGEHVTFWGSGQEDGRFGAVLSITFRVRPTQAPGEAGREAKRDRGTPQAGTPPQ